MEPQANLRTKLSLTSTHRWIVRIFLPADKRSIPWIGESSSGVMSLSIYPPYHDQLSMLMTGDIQGQVHSANTLQNFLFNAISPSLIGIFSTHPRLFRAAATLVAGKVIVTYFKPHILSIVGCVLSYFTTSVEITAPTDLYAVLQRWLHRQPKLLPDTAWKARKKSRVKHGGLDVEQIKIRGRPCTTLEYESVTPLQIVFFQSRLFIFSQRPNQTSRTEHAIIVRCFGLSPAPIKSLLRHVCTEQETVFSDNTTVIYRPERSLGDVVWSQAIEKIKRPLSTIDLEKEQKANLVNDIDSYLADSTREWYRECGIPYRRGYLFHGGAGQGKSSLSMALAGHYGLDIYMLSLLDPTINDSSLLDLFNSLPSRSMVVLEDIDAAGLTREVPQDVFGVMELPDDKPGHVREVRRSYVTLSGLLNAIDGIGAPEGHILVMTSNCPDVLDEALKRPGRIDVEVAFKNATREQARALFLRLYQRLEVMDLGAYHGITREEAADVFAGFIPDYIFSPAELQDIFIANRDYPSRALSRIRDLVDLRSGLNKSFPTRSARPQGS